MWSVWDSQIMNCTPICCSAFIWNRRPSFISLTYLIVAGRFMQIYKRILWVLPTLAECPFNWRLISYGVMRTASQKLIMICALSIASIPRIQKTSLKNATQFGPIVYILCSDICQNEYLTWLILKRWFFSPLFFSFCFWVAQNLYFKAYDKHWSAIFFLLKV